jgi:murein DD-endopeptidase MepM/ murein hydrolase activator NlpD
MRAHRSSSTTLAVLGLAFLALVSTGTHTVRRGETLREIATAHHTSIAALTKANSITDPDIIRVGEVLRIPGGTGAAKATTTTYKVRPGDTLGTIASRHGSSVAAIVTANDLSNPNLIRIGQVLKIAASSASAGGGGGVQAPAGGATTHVVRRGETLSGIASRYDLPIAQLVAANGITGERIYVGQQLRLVPTPGTASGSGGSYEVRSGDTLTSIAKRFGTTVRALQAANDISNPNLVPSGTTLKIPAGGGGGGGAIRCPVPGSRFMNDWGFPRSGGRFHEGNDLFAARGTPVYATVSGTVVQTVGVLGGNQVKLFGDDGVSYYYTHLDRFGSKGRVSAGTVVGYVGTTGNAVGTSPHVHFEVHPGGGAAVNPYPRLVAAC